MLASGFSESTSDEITLTEDSFEAVRAVLLFLHTDRLEVDDEHAVEVLRLSMMWELPRLQSLAQDSITRRVTASSVCAFLSAANAHDAPGLRAFCGSISGAQFRVGSGEREFCVARQRAPMRGDQSIRI